MHWKERAPEGVTRVWRLETVGKTLRRVGVGYQCGGVAWGKEEVPGSQSRPKGRPGASPLF